MSSAHPGRAAPEQATDGYRSTGVPSILHTALALTLVKVSLLILGFARTHDWIGAAIARRRRPAPPRPRQTETVEAIASRVAAVAAFFPARALCLEQSLALHWLLGGRGIPSTLRLGVQPFPFTAHAWVEHEGAPVNETRDGMKGIVPFPAIPERLP